MLRRVQQQRQSLELNITEVICDFVFHRRIASMVVERLGLVYDLVHSRLGHTTSLAIFTQQGQLRKMHDQLRKASRADY